MTRCFLEMPVRYVEAAIPFDFAGIHIQDLTAATLGASASVARLSVPSGSQHPTARSRRCDKYYVARSGAVDFSVGESHITLTPYALLVIERDEWFAFENRTIDAAELLLIHVPPFELSAEEFAKDAALP